MEVEGWSPPLAPATFLDELKNAGYDGTELGPYGYLPTDAELLGAELRQRSLALISAFVPLRLKEPNTDLEPVRQVGRLLGALGARHVVLADALWPEREAVAGRVEETEVQLTFNQWVTLARNLGTASEAAAAFGLRCVFHHHAGSYIETPREIARLLEFSDIGLCLDTGHYIYGSGDPVEAVERFGPRVEYLHFKDVNAERLADARQAKLGFLDGVRTGVFCPLGAGCVRFLELMQSLERIGYDGWAVVEQDVDTSGQSATTPFQDAWVSREFLRNQLGI